MTIEKLIEEARKKRPIAEQLLMDGKHQERMKRLDIKLAREFKASIVTEEQLNRVINL